MKGTFKGYDPELGKKFAAESNGLVIGRARSSPRKSEEQVRLEYIAEHGRAPDAQQLHDAMLASGDPPTATQESLKARWAKMTPQQREELVDKAM